MNNSIRNDQSWGRRESHQLTFPYNYFIWVWNGKFFIGYSSFLWNVIEEVLVKLLDVIGEVMGFTRLLFFFLFLQGVLLRSVAEVAVLQLTWLSFAQLPVRLWERLSCRAAPICKTQQEQKIYFFFLYKYQVSSLLFHKRSTHTILQIVNRN